MATRNKRRRDASGHVDPYFQRRKRYEAVLRVLGLWELFARMPRVYQELYWKRKVPDPGVEFDETFPTDPVFRKSIETAFRAAAIKVNGMTMNVRDFFAVLTGCALVIKYTEPQILKLLTDEVRAFMREAGPKLESCYEEQFKPALRELVDTVQERLIAGSRLDTRLLTARTECVQVPKGKMASKFVLSSTAPQIRRVSIDGASRLVYRAAVTLCHGGVQWISWNESLLDPKPRLVDDPQKQYPIYVQSHALRRLRQRINLPQAMPYVESWLAASLEVPKVVERHRSGEMLVEFRIKEHRLGYLIVTPLKEQGVVVVRTFKFLTMKNTPESRLLKRHMRLEQLDIDHLRLNDLAVFTQTDVRTDPLLRRKLESCGCGHLFKIAEGDDWDFSPQPKPFAAEVRRYLKLSA